MSAIRMKKRIESEMLHLPELKPLIGKTVEILIREETPAKLESGCYDAFFDLAGEDVVDPDAYIRSRSISQL